jgi:hypothetical protein
MWAMVHFAVPYTQLMVRYCDHIMSLEFLYYWLDVPQWLEGFGYWLSKLCFADIDICELSQVTPDVNRPRQMGQSEV